MLKNDHEKMLANARFSSQGGQGRRMSKVAIKGAIVDTGLLKVAGQNNDGGCQSNTSFSSLSFYERKLKQKELMDQLNALQRQEKEQAKLN